MRSTLYLKFIIVYILFGFLCIFSVATLTFNLTAAPLVEKAAFSLYQEVNLVASNYLPPSKPMLATMTLFYGVGNWNSWFNHMIFLRDRAKYPLQLIMREILIANRQGSGENLRQGDEVVVQITGEALKTKQPTASENRTLTGQYCVCGYFGH